MEAVTQDEPRTTKATRAAQLAAQHKRAGYLIERGWICIPPDVDPATWINGAVRRSIPDEGA